MSSNQITMLAVFIVLFAVVTVMGFVAARWRRGDLGELNEWGLGGRRFGTVVSWFLLGGDLYTAYTFIAVPGALFALVANGGPTNFFAVPYTIITYPIVFLFMPRLWSVAKKHGYITTSDFVKGRFGSSGLALAMAFTGILATLPYIALQLVGIQVVIAALGLQGQGIMADLPLIIAFIILAAFTYTSGLRAPAMIALVKDLLIYITVIAAVIIIPAQLGGYSNIFHIKGIPDTLFLLKPPAVDKLGMQSFGTEFAYATLAFGSALALFLYPHSVTGSLAANSRTVIKRNAALLPAYSFLLGLIALLGYMALAAGVGKNPAYTAYFKQYGGSFAVPALFVNQFPAWFAGFALAAIAIGALVPAAVMSIAAANLFTRNVWKEYIRPNMTAAQESQVAKLTSLVVKFGALLVIIFVPVQNAINFQLLGGVWIIQTLPSVVIGLYTRFFHRWALLIGWVVGMVTGTAMCIFTYAPDTFNITGLVTKVGVTFNLPVGGFAVLGYAAFFSLLANLVVTTALSAIFNLVPATKGADETARADYTVDVPVGVAVAD